jgi:uncharacterized membrane protein
MNATGRLILVAVAMVILDLPWLTFIGGDYNAAVQKIQGGKEVRMRPIAGVVVYPALAFLALRTSSLRDAFLTGAAVYAVYDFTVLAVFKDYPLYLAIGDTLWGGILFSAVYFLRQTFKVDKI